MHTIRLWSTACLAGLAGCSSDTQDTLAPEAEHFLGTWNAVLERVDGDCAGEVGEIALATITITPAGAGMRVVIDEGAGPLVFTGTTDGERVTLSGSATDVGDETVTMVASDLIVTGDEMDGFLSMRREGDDCSVVSTVEAERRGSGSAGSALGAWTWQFAVDSFTGGCADDEELIASIGQTFALDVAIGDFGGGELDVLVDGGPPDHLEFVAATFPTGLDITQSGNQLSGSGIADAPDGTVGFTLDLTLSDNTISGSLRLSDLGGNPTCSVHLDVVGARVAGLVSAAYVGTWRASPDSPPQLLEATASGGRLDLSLAFASSAPLRLEARGVVAAADGEFRTMLPGLPGGLVVAVAGRAAADELIGVTELRDAVTGARISAAPFVLRAP